MDRQAVHDDMDRARTTFHQLLDGATDAELRRPSNGTRWTNRQLLFHMLLGYLILRALLMLVRVFNRLPAGVSRSYARLLNKATRPFDAVNYFGSRPSNDIAVLDALLDAGADIEAPGAVIGGGTPLADARAFGQWQAAHRLVERGAVTTVVDAATLGLQDRLESYFDSTPTSQDEIHHAFWGACHGGQQQCAEYLLNRGAETNWIPSWENLTPLDAAQRSEASELVRWLRYRGGMSARELS